jgi:hypothetical protein
VYVLRTSEKIIVVYHYVETQRRHSITFRASLTAIGGTAHLHTAYAPPMAGEYSSTRGDLGTTVPQRVEFLYKRYHITHDNPCRFLIVLHNYGKLLRQWS